MQPPAALFDREALETQQQTRLHQLLGLVLESNPFYQRKLAGLGPETPLTELPFTSKAELLADQETYPLYGSNLSFPLEEYARLHQTSGTTTGRPLRWLDTPESWQSLLTCWEAVYQTVEVRKDDRLFFPFSFGPFLGFWTAFDAGCQRGCLCLPAGGLSTAARLRLLLEQQATVICCTPTYALHLAEVAATEGLDLASSAVRLLIVAGEPGACIPATRERIEYLWQARLIDHYGLTEVGPVAVEPLDHPHSMVILEPYYIAEVLIPGGDTAAADGALGELVLTNLERGGSPLIRYRTGDLVRPAAPVQTPVGLLRRLDGGILGRVDDMIHLRGNNLYPSAVEAIVRRFAEVVEFRLVVDERQPLTGLRIELEPVAAPASEVCEAVRRALRDELLFRAEVVSVPPGSLPRFEMKAKRIVRLRSES